MHSHCACEMKRRHSINVSPCKQSRHSTVCRLEQPACCGWRRRRIVSGEGVEAKPEQSSHSVCYACRQPDFSGGLPSCCALICQSSSSPGLGGGGGAVWHSMLRPSPPLPRLPLWSMWSHLLRADLYAHCISAPFWVTIPTPRCSHFYD